MKVLVWKETTMKAVFVTKVDNLPIDGSYENVSMVVGYKAIKEGENPLEVGFGIAIGDNGETTIADYQQDGYLRAYNENMWVLEDGYANNPITYTIEVVEL